MFAKVFLSTNHQKRQLRYFSHLLLATLSGEVMEEKDAKAAAMLRGKWPQEEKEEEPPL